MSNEKFKKAVQQWVSYDQQITLLNKQVKDYRDKKEQQERSIITYIECNNLHNTKFKINECNLSYKVTETPSTLTLKLVGETLREYIKNDAIVESIIKSINKKRQENGKVTKNLRKKKN
jgi:dTDP-D-glucose 4,6-dehydratase